MDEEDGFKSGFVGIIGRPNVGKSTLLNNLAKQKLSIISDKPQTTRNVIRAVINRPGVQLVFVDSPGFHKPREALGEKLNSMVRTTMRDVDVILFVLDGTQTIGKGDIFIAGELEKVDTPVIGVINKVDLLDEGRILSQLEVARHLLEFRELFPLSAKTGNNVNELVETLSSYLPEGPMYFPPETKTDQPERVLVGELIREKALELTRDEVPHSVAVMVERIEPREDGVLIEIDAVIYVERESQKGIIVGRGGKMIREVGTRARREIEPILGNKVFMDLRVKVEKNWSKNPDFIKKLEYE